MRTVLGRILTAGLAAVLAVSVAAARQKTPPAKSSQIDSSGVDLVDSARTAAEKGHLDEALSLCDRTLAVEPDNVNAL